MKNNNSLIKPTASTVLLTCMLLLSHLQLKAQEFQPPILDSQTFPVTRIENYTDYIPGLSKWEIIAFNKINKERAAANMPPVALSAKLSYALRLQVISNTIEKASLDIECPDNTDDYTRWANCCDDTCDKAEHINTLYNSFNLASKKLYKHESIKGIGKPNDIHFLGIGTIESVAVGIVFAKDYEGVLGHEDGGVHTHVVYATDTTPEEMDDIWLYYTDDVSVNPMHKQDGYHSYATTVSWNGGNNGYLSTDTTLDFDNDGVPNYQDPVPHGFANSDVVNIPDRGTPTTVNVLSNDIISEPITSIELINKAGVYPNYKGTATFNASNELVYTPHDSETSGEILTLHYKVCLTGGDCSFGTVTINIIADDTNPPTITYTGANPISHTQGTAFTMPAVTANDTEDGDITASITNVIREIPSNNTLTNINTSTPTGTYTITYNVSDAAGNAANPLTITVNVAAADTTAPAKPTVNALTTNNEKPIITGTYDDTDATHLAVTVNGVTYSSTSSPEITISGSNWSLDLSTLADADMLPEGTYDVEVTTTDMASNSSVDDTTNELIIDITKPTPATITSGLCSNTGTPTITGTWDESNNTNSRIEINGGGSIKRFDLSDSELTSDGSGNWTLDLSTLATPLPDGMHSFSVVTTDEAGNSITFSETAFKIDSTTTLAIPTVTAQVTNNDKPTIEGVHHGGADWRTLKVEVNSVEYVANKSNGVYGNPLSTSGPTWSLDLSSIANTLPEGTYDVKVTTIDDCSNSSTDTTTNEIIIDTTDPLMPTVNALTTNTQKPTITGTYHDTEATHLAVTVNAETYNWDSDVAIPSDPELTVSGSNWTLDLSTLADEAMLPEGTYDVAVTTTDDALNSSVDDTTNELIIDTTAPTITVSQTPIFYTSGDPLFTLPSAVLSDNIDSDTTLQGNLQIKLFDANATETPLTTAIPAGSYNITYALSDSAGNAADAKTIILNVTEATIPVQVFIPPTVNALSTEITKPVISGTYDTTTKNGALTVELNAVTYTLGTSPELTVDGSGNWQLDLSAATSDLPVNSYDIVVTTINPANDTPVVDSSTNELAIVAAGTLDTDGDGDPNVTDPDDDNDGTPDVEEINDGTDPLVANAEPLRASFYYSKDAATGASLALTFYPSNHSDFPSNSDITIEDLQTGTARGRVEIIRLGGVQVLRYYPLKSDIGANNITTNYRVCNTAVTPNVCAENTITYNIISQDTDGDGNPDHTDPNIRAPTTAPDYINVSYDVFNVLDVLENDDFVRESQDTKLFVVGLVSRDIVNGIDTYNPSLVFASPTDDNFIRFKTTENINIIINKRYEIRYYVCHKYGTADEVCRAETLYITCYGDGPWLTNPTQELYTLQNHVGIGTNDPDYDLHVVGSTKTDQLLVGDEDHPLIETFEDDHYMIIDGHLHISDPEYAGEANRWAGKYDGFLLWADGGIVSKDMAFADVDEGDWSDFVFKDDYKLPTLENIEAHIKNNGHLHTMPSVAEIVENGYRQKDINKRMLQTIEELTLHIIEQGKKIEKLTNSLESLQNNKTK